MTQKKIFFVTGASTSGKTTIVPHLRKQLSAEFIVYDFDQRGVPDNVTEDWRREETRYWLQEGIRNAEQGKSTIVCGASIPSEVAANTDLLKNIEPQYALLDISSSEIRQRFTERLSTKEMQKEWTRTTGLSLRESVERNTAFASLLRKICQNYDCKVFNTTRSTPEQVAEKLANWIKNRE